MRRSILLAAAALLGGLSLPPGRAVAAGPTLTVYIGGVTGSGSLALMDVSYTFDGLTGDTIEGIQISFVGSDPVLTAGGTDFSRFTFTLDGSNPTLGAWTGGPIDDATGAALYVPADAVAGPCLTQTATPVGVAFDDAAVADLFDRLADAGVPPGRFARVWVHTHPGADVTPSRTDEGTFARAFGGCDWAVMAVLGRTGRTSARLRFAAGPGGSVELRTAVDWAAWPAAAVAADHPLADRVAGWAAEYATLVDPVPVLPPDMVTFGDEFSGGPGEVPDPALDPLFDGGWHAFG